MAEQPKFQLGRLIATPAALKAIRLSGQCVAEFLGRHAQADWGDLEPADKQANDQALKDGSRLLSVFHTRQGTKLFVITEAVDDQGERAATTVLLATEY